MDKPDSECDEGLTRVQHILGGWSYDETSKESKSWNREVEGGRERVKTTNKRICMNRWIGKCSRSFVRIRRWEVLRIPRFSVCFLVVSPFVLAVNVLVSNVNLLCQMVFSDSECELLSRSSFFFLSLFRKREENCGFGKWDGNEDGGGKRNSTVDCARTRARRQDGTIPGEK